MVGLQATEAEETGTVLQILQSRILATFPIPQRMRDPHFAPAARPAGQGAGSVVSPVSSW